MTKRCLFFSGHDYFSRHICTKAIENKECETIFGVMKNWGYEGYFPETIVSDDWKEFSIYNFKAMYTWLAIKHRMVGIESQVKTVKSSVL